MCVAIVWIVWNAGAHGLLLFVRALCMRRVCRLIIRTSPSTCFLKLSRFLRTSEPRVVVARQASPLPVQMWARLQHILIYMYVQGDGARHMDLYFSKPALGMNVCL